MSDHLCFFLLLYPFIIFFLFVTAGSRVLLHQIGSLVLSLQIFEYERLVRILLHGVSDTEQEGFVQRIAIYLINSLACQVDGAQKSFLGELGAIKV